MELFKFYSSMRSDIIKTIAGIQDSGLLLFDNTKCNSEIRYELITIRNKYLEEASQFGYYIIEHHFPCKNPSHNTLIKRNSQGKDINFEDKRYIKQDYEIFNIISTSYCPCEYDKMSNKHEIIGFAYIDSTLKKIDFDSMTYIFEEIFDAIECAGDNKPRSAIRERILNTILAINDELLPETMGSYIKNKLRSY